MSSRGIIASSIKKKRKITSTTTLESHEPSSLIENITQLPHDSIVAIADYLPKTSRALLAVALSTAPAPSFRGRDTGEISEASKAIITSKKLSRQFSGYKNNDSSYALQIKEYYNGDWDILDFIDIQSERPPTNRTPSRPSHASRRKYLLDKLTDDDVYAILVCINAKHTLKKARLSKCTKLVGDCLDPLRGSLVLEHITVGKQYDIFYCSLSVSAVIPVLDSIIDNSGNALRELSLPQRWVNDKSRNDPPLSDFLVRFNKMMLTKEVKCTSCPVICPGTNGNSCQICFKRICSNCDAQPDEDGWFDPDEQPFIHSCDNCNQHMCSSCGDFAICMECESVHCSICAELDGVDAAQRCSEDMCEGEKLCLGCRDPDSMEGCDGCQNLVYSKLLEEKNRLAKEVKRLTEEVKRLNTENDEH